MNPIASAACASHIGSSVAKTRFHDGADVAGGILSIQIIWKGDPTAAATPTITVAGHEVLFGEIVFNAIVDQDGRFHNSR
jgi:hypothetical protein